MARLTALVLFALVLIAPASAQDLVVGDPMDLRAMSPRKMADSLGVAPTRPDNT